MARVNSNVYQMAHPRHGNARTAYNKISKVLLFEQCMDINASSYSYSLMKDIKHKWRVTTTDTTILG